MFIREFRQAVDFNAGIMINSFSITKWLSFRLGLLTSAFATLVTIVCMLISPINQSIANYTGIIVSYSMSISYILE